MKKEPNFPAMPRYPRQNSVSEAEIAKHKAKYGFTDFGDFAPKPRPPHRNPKPKKERKKRAQVEKKSTYGPTAKIVYEHLLEHKEIREGDCGMSRQKITQAINHLRTAGIKGIETVRVELQDGEKNKGSLKVDYYKLQA